MSNLVLPAFPGWDISLRRMAEWKTTVRETGSGREFALRHWTTPRYRYEMRVNLLRAGTEREMQSFIAFFNTHRGSFDTWLFEDPDDRAVVAEPFGVGNGIATAFQLVRAWDAWTDAIYELNGAPTIAINGVTTTAWTVDSKGKVTFTTAPASGAALTWTGAYFWRCRFDTDTQDVERFLHQMYEARKVSFKTVKP